MSNFKGTKGKWKAINNGPHWNNRAIDNWVIEFSEYGEVVSDHVYNEYDALLISKAPEMLEMLERIANMEGMYPDVVRNVSKVIKEATEL